MERSVLHLNLTDFPVEAERLVDPALRGRPILISAPSPRSRVFWASSEARAWKAERGMFLSDALKVCRDARVIPPDERLYARVRENVLQILGRYSPVIEPSKVGRVFADLTGTGRLFGPSRDTALRINREVRREIGLPSSLGLSTNKSTSEVASGIVENDLVDVFPGGEETFLAPQPARMLPGIEEADPDLIEELNIRHIRQFAQMPIEQVNLVFGKIGPLLHLRARGLDPRPVRPPEIKPSIIEEKELEEDTNNREELFRALYRLVERCGFRLRAAKSAAAQARVVVCYSDRIQADGKTRVDPPSDLDVSLYKPVRELFLRVLSRRVRVSYLAVAFTDLAARPGQFVLFQSRDPFAEERVLLHALDDIRTRFGTDVIDRGVLSCRASSI